MTEYKITWRSQFDHIRMLIFFTFICYLILKAGVYFWGEETLNAGLIAGGAWYLVVNFIPQAILHVRYLILNYKMELNINFDSGQLSIKTRRYANTFSMDDIKGIINYKTCSKSSFTILPWDGYAYMVIYLINGDRYVITSLMAKDLEIKVEDNSKFDTFFPYPLKGQRFISHSLSGIN
jgi:hypothetical protein